MVGFSAVWGSDGTQGTGRVTNAIANASRRTGVDFAYLMGQAQIESGMNANAKARSSSATGLFQFLDQSWLSVMKNHGTEHGMGWASDSIQQASNGRYYVADPSMRQQILDLRKNPETASVMAAEFASDNRDYLESRTGRTAESVDLYLAHFLGAAGATKFLNAASSNPNASGASLFPIAARANRGVFYDKQGSPRSLSEIRQMFASKLDASARNAAGADVQYADAGTGSVQPSDYVRIEQQRLAQNQAWSETADEQPAYQPKTEAARLAYLMLATLGR